MKTDEVLERLKRAKEALAGSYFAAVAEASIDEINRLRAAIVRHRDRANDNAKDHMTHDGRPLVLLRYYVSALEQTNAQLWKSLDS